MKKPVVDYSVLTFDERRALSFDEKEAIVKSFRPEAKTMNAKITIRTDCLGVFWSVIAPDGLNISTCSVWFPEYREKYRPFLELEQRIKNALGGDHFLARYRGF